MRETERKSGHVNSSYAPQELIANDGTLWMCGARARSETCSSRSPQTRISCLWSRWISWQEEN